MTRDLKRLVKVAERICQEHYWQAAAPEATAEAIVRAVLTELRNPSKEAIAAGAIAIDDAHNSTTGSDGHEWTFTNGYDYALPGLQAVIDHVLTDAPSPETQSTVKAG